MPNSQSIETIVYCENCQHESSCKVWIIVDVQERLDLLENIKDQSIHAMECPNCQYKDYFNAPLLVFQPDEPPHLLFVPDKLATEEHNREMAEQLIGTLQATIGDGWRVEWLRKDIPILSLVQIATALEEGLEAAIQKETGQKEQSNLNIPNELQAISEEAIDAKKQFQLTGQPHFLDLAIASWNRILQAPTFKDVYYGIKVAIIGELGQVLYERYLVQDGKKDLEKAIEFAQQAVALSQKGSSDKSFFLNSLSAMLSARFNQNNDLDDLQAAIDATQQAIRLTPEGSPEIVERLCNLSTMLHTRYERSGNILDLDAAIETIQQVLSLSQEGHPEKTIILYFLGSILADRYDHSGDLADLEMAIQIAQQAIQLTPEGSPDKAVSLANLGNSLADRYNHSGDLADLEEAIEVFQLAVQLTPEDESDMANRLNNLGIILSYRFNHSGDPADLEKAVEVSQQAVQLTPEDSLDMANRQKNLYARFYERFKLSGDLADLEKAIEISQQIVQITPEGSSDMYSHLTNLGIVLADRYSHSGDLADLEEAIKVFQLAVQLTPEGSSDIASRLNYLCVLLYERFKRFGDLADLDKAIEISQRTVEITPEISPNKAMYHNNLGNMLTSRFKRFYDLTDLQDAIDAAQQATQLATEGSPDNAMYLNSLGFTLLASYEYFSDLADLDKAIEFCHQAVNLTNEGSPDNAMYHNNLGVMLSTRFKHSGDPADLQEAKRAIQLANQFTSDENPNKAVMLASLGILLAYQYNQSGDLADLEKAKKIFHQVVQSGKLINPELLIIASRLWGRLCLDQHDWDQALEALSHTKETIDSLVRLHALRENKEAWLQEVRGITAQKVYALARLNRLEEAVVTLESGRSRLHSAQLTRKGVDLETLTSQNPQLAERYQAITDEMVALQSEYQQSSHIQREIQSWEGPPVRSTQELRERLRELDLEIGSLFEEIRKEQGFEDLFRTLTFQQITKAAMDAPLIYIAVTTTGGLVLMVTENGQITPLWIDDLTTETLEQQWLGPSGALVLQGYIGAYLDWKETEEANWEENRQAWLHAIDRVTAWLWEQLMGPVCGLLIEHGFTEACMLPDGLLTLLPLHAAWTEDSSTPTKRRYAIDDVLIRYLPNAQALLAAQPGAQRTTENALIISNPNPFEPHNIPFSAEVVEAVREFFPDEDQHILLEENNATHIEVSQHMQDASVLHFWTHGFANLLRPLDSSLLMAGEQHLQLRDILRLDLGKARLAFLAGCETSLIGLRNIDEVVSLSTGLLQAGVPGAIGTMWTVLAVSTMMLVARFYELWCGGVEDINPSEALRKAQIWLRDSTNKEKEEYYQEWLEKKSEVGTPRMPTNVAQVALQEMLIKTPNERSFAHPFFWAAFGYFGV